jgi:carbamoyltransferase
MTIVLGISAYYHDSAACLIIDGEIVAAAQEERFTRLKHDAGFPRNAINYCLKEAQVDYEAIDFIVYYDKPFLKFERILETYLAFAPKGFRSFMRSLPIWIKEKLFQKKLLISELKKCLGNNLDYKEILLFSQHHLSHAASAFFPSPFESAAILTMDGVGEWATTTISVGSGNKIDFVSEIRFPHSIGLLYSAFTFFAGFKVNSGEYKLMGLAPYGKPVFADLIKKHLVDIKDDGSFTLNMHYFDYCAGLKMTNKSFESLFEGPPRSAESPITEREMDLAASIQLVTEEIILKICRHIRNITGEKNLCLAGGVALNCVANGKILEGGTFENIWIQPASGDAGGSLGSALAVFYSVLGNPRIVEPRRDSMKGSYLGPEFSQSEVEQQLTKLGAKFISYSTSEIIDITAHSLAQGKTVGWMQGRMEFGPRALGARSILADARSEKMQRLLNKQVKFRESFRPFAPSVLIEKADEYFDLKVESPYMLLTAAVSQRVRKKEIFPGSTIEMIERLNISRSRIPAVTHVDYSARVQTVHEDANPIYHKLLTRFYEITDCPVLINTSFNVRSEPIVCTPEDAYRCFMGTDLDLLVINNAILIKDDQPNELRQIYYGEFILD